MARAPTGEDLPEVGLRRTREVIDLPQNAALDASVRVVDRNAEFLGAITEQENELALARADLDTQLALGKIREQLSTDDDWQTVPDRARALAAGVFEQNGQRLRGAATQRAWTRRRDERLAEFDVQVRSMARERGVQLARADLVRLGDESLTIAGDLTQEEGLRSQAVRTYLDAITMAADRGFLDPDQAAEQSVRFAEQVRSRVAQGLVAEFTERVSLDPDELAGEIESGGVWSALDPDDRARLLSDARRAGAEQVLDEALQLTLRTGEIISDADERFADRWRHLGDGARLDYANRAARAAEIHGAARALGEMSSLSLPEIVQRADQAGSDGDGDVARALLRTIRQDPVTYALRQWGPAASRLETLRAAQAQLAALTRSSQSSAVAQEQLAQARLAAASAARDYGNEILRAQDAMGLPQSARRLHYASTTAAWAQSVRAMPPARQAEEMDRMRSNALWLWGDEDLAALSIAEFEAAYADAANGATPATIAADRANQPDVAAAQGRDPQEAARILREVYRRMGVIPDGIYQDTVAGMDNAQLRAVFDALSAEERAALGGQ